MLLKELPDAPRRLPLRRRVSGLPVFLWLLRVVIVAVTMQFSGMAHYAADAVHVIEGVALHEGRISCPSDDRGEECPPGCPDCHCAHVVWALPPTCPGVGAAVDPGIEVGFAYQSLGPPSEAPRSLFRPPRSLPTSARA